MEYIKIYGSSRYRSEPFILAVSDNQYLIDGFKQEWSDIIHDYKIVLDDNYDKYSDYYILEFENRFITDKMLTDFYTYYMSEYDTIAIIMDVIQADLDIFIFDDEENDILMDGLDPLLNIFSQTAPTDLEEMRSEGRVLNHDIFNVSKLLEKFIMEYEISYDY